MLGYLMRPNAALTERIGRALGETGLGAALADRGRLVIGMHVRHGDACNADEVIRARRSCSPLDQYMAAARRLVASHRAAAAAAGASGGGGVAPGPPKVTIYLATDSSAVLRDAKAYAAEFEIVHLGVREVGRHDKVKDGAALLWDKRVWQRYFWGQTDWTQQQAFDATLEAMLLGRADAFVGKFSSNLFRIAYSLRAAQCDCAPAFVSLDAPWCFDYGLREGRNWEWPLLNASVGRDRRDALFEC